MNMLPLKFVDHFIIHYYHYNETDLFGSIVTKISILAFSDQLNCFYKISC